MGRPGTPGPSDHGGNKENKATFSGTVLLLAILSFVLGAVAVAVPRWGYFTPGSSYPGGSLYTQSTLDGSGYFGPFLKCAYTLGGYGAQCNLNNAKYELFIYMRLAGGCAILATAAIGIFCVFAALHTMMQTNNKNICLGYRKNIFCALIAAIVADLATIAAVALAAPQFSSRQQYRSQLGPCFYIEICLILFNMLLVALAYVSYRKALKTNFPLQRGQNYVISPEQYGTENPAGPQHGGRGVTVTAQSGVHYSHHQQPAPGPATLHTTQLPPYPAPSTGPGFYPAQPNGQPGLQGHTNNGYQFGQVAQPQQPQGLLQQHQRAYVPSADPMGVSSNPMGRSVRMAPSGGSIDTLNTTDGDNTSMLSFGSTGSYSSATSINNPMRSSLKKPKNKETASVASAASKKSVRIALGEEQTAV